MKDFFEELRSRIPLVEIDIKETILSGWEEYRNELKLDSYAASKKIILGLGDLLKDDTNKLLAYSILFALFKNKGQEEQDDAELESFLLQGMNEFREP